jgi:hydroxymethylglutaryl-CoA lyase
VFDAAAGGLGGCPFAPGAKGNVDTVAVHDYLTAQGFETCLDEEKLTHAAAFARSLRSAA